VYRSDATNHLIDGSINVTKTKMKKALRGDANTSALAAEPKKSPRRRPLPGGAGRPKFNQPEMVTT